MSFAFVNLIIFSAITFLIYFLTPKKYQWIVLLMASMVFYALMDYRALVYIAVTICTVFFCGKYLQQSKDNKKRKRAIAATMVFNFGILFFVKYLNFLLELFNINPPSTKNFFLFLVPIGISFYTFQAIGYLIDVYRRKYPAENNLAKFALFVSFFPQIVQGPIGRYDQLASQLYAGHDFDYTEFTNGLKLMGWGFFKKLLIADALAPFVYNILNDSYYIGPTIAFGVIMSMLVLYSDFSGGIDVSRGIAQCMGITMAENFRRPYFATSVPDFWRRWHMTLGAWMKDYLLYSFTFSKTFFKMQKFLRAKLGETIGKLIPTAMCMGLVFFVIGLWHGGNSKFVFFGLYYGSLMMLGILFKPLINKLGITKEDKFFTVFAHIRTLLIIFIGQLFISAGSFSHGWQNFKALWYGIFFKSGWIMFKDNLVHNMTDKAQLAVYIFPVLVLLGIEILQERGIRIRQSFSKKPVIIRWAVYYFFMLYILLFCNLLNIRDLIYAQF